MLSARLVPEDEDRTRRNRPPEDRLPCLRQRHDALVEVRLLQPRNRSVGRGRVHPSVDELDRLARNRHDALDVRDAVSVVRRRRIEDDDVAALVRLPARGHLVDQDVVAGGERRLHGVQLLEGLRHEGVDDEEQGRSDPLRRRQPVVHSGAMARDEKLEHLKRVPLFSRLGHAELERLGQLADEVEVGLDRHLTEQGETGHEFFVVLDGRLTVLDGKRPLTSLGPGDFFGEIALLDGRPRTATVRADGLARVLVIGHREFHALMDEFPTVRKAVLDAVVARLRRSEGA